MGSLVGTLSDSEEEDEGSPMDTQREDGDPKTREEETPADDLLLLMVGT